MILMRMQPETTRYYRLDAAATLAGLSTRRVRAYVRHGLVRPARIEGRQVLFSDAELAQLRRIRRLADDLGINLAGIEVTLRLLDEVARLREGLTERERSR
jgi:MerR family transcriptional regulator/heat shock protein HspR